MAGFIGNKPGAKYATLTRQTFSTPTGTSHTLSQTVTNSDDLLLYINNVKQNPADYTASGTTLTTASLAGGTEMYCLYYGKTTETVAVPASSVGDSHIVDMAASKLTGTIADARFPATLPASSGANLTSLPAHTGNVAFPATQVASADANTLDDYEEGNWTPQLTDGTNTNTTNVHNNLGSYVKIGRIVFISCTVSTSAIGSLSGQIWLGGLPFTVYNSSLGFASVGGSGGGMGLTAGYNLTGNFNANSTQMAIYVWDLSTSTSPMQASEWGGGSTQMTFAGHYFV